jgi:hypothetical protein
MPSPFRRFHHVTVAVDDPEVVAADWSALFGIPVVRMADGPRLAVGDAWIAFTRSDDGATRVARVAVEVDDAAPLLERARAEGLTSGGEDGPPFVDLTGVCIELCEDDGRVEPSADSVFTRIHHVVVAVADEHDALERWGRVFPFTPAPEGPDGLVLHHHVPVGDAWFGITASGTDAGAVARFVERRGEGVYALSIVVPDRTAAAQAVADAGGRIVGGPDDFQVYVHPSSTHGVLLELADEWPGNIRRPAH